MGKQVLLVVRWPIGGIRTFMSYVYEAFDPEQWTFTIVAPDMEMLRDLLRHDLAHLDIKLVPLPEKPSAAKMASAVAGQLFSRRFDLVHSHGFTSGICTALSAPLRGTTHLMTFHETLGGSRFSGVGGTLQKILMGGLFRTMSKIHAVSHDARENLLSYFGRLNPEKVSVVPNGIEVARFADAEPRDLHGELDLGREYFLIGFLGRFMPPKGFSYLVEAVELLSRADDLPRKPIVLCFGWGGYIREEQKKLQEKGMDRFFRFLPFVPNVAPSIKGLDVVAMPSLWEACGLLAMEVLASGTPLVSSKCIGLREVVRDTPATMIPSHDGPALAAALRRHMERDLSGEFREFASAARERFDVRHQTEGMLEMYRELTR